MQSKDFYKNSETAVNTGVDVQCVQAISSAIQKNMSKFMSKNRSSGLSDARVKTLPRQSKTYRKADSGGLCIEVRPSGSKLWRWRYYFDNKPQMASLGCYPEVSLAEARKLRDEARAQLKTCKHPTREKKAQKLRRLHDGKNTFEIIAREVLENKPHLNSRYRNQSVSRFRRHVSRGHAQRLTILALKYHLLGKKKRIALRAYPEVSFVVKAHGVTLSV